MLRSMESNRIYLMEIKIISSFAEIDENSNKVALWGGGVVNAILSDQIFDYEISSKNDKVLSSDFTVIINIFRKTSSRTHKKATTVSPSIMNFNVPVPAFTCIQRFRDNYILSSESV